MNSNNKPTIEYRLEPTLDKKQYYLDLYRPYYDSLDNARMLRYDSLKSLTVPELYQLADFIKIFLENRDG